MLSKIFRKFIVFGFFYLLLSSFLSDQVYGCTFIQSGSSTMNGACDNFAACEKYGSVMYENDGVCVEYNGLECVKCTINWSSFNGADCACSSGGGVPTASLNGYITLNGGGKVGQTAPASRSTCGIYWGSLYASSCYTSAMGGCEGGACCWSDIGSSGDCTSVAGGSGVNISSGSNSAGWRCGSEVKKSINACWDKDPDNGSWKGYYWIGPVYDNNLSFGFSGCCGLNNYSIRIFNPAPFLLSRIEYCYFVEPRY